MFTIHSIGDAAFLEQILISVSMVTGTGDFERMISIGLLISVLIISFQSIFQGAKSWDLHQVFVAWLLYGLAFGTGTTVTIEDAYDRNVRVVSNVPIGPAAIGSTISEVGYGITKLFEIAYSPIAPGITERKFLDSLELLVQLRNTQTQSALWNTWNNSLGGGAVDIKKSMVNYISECTAIKLNLGEITEDEMNTQNWQEAIRFESSLFGTKLFLLPAGPVDVTCNEGWIQLSQSTEAAFSAGLSQQTLGYLIDQEDPITATSNALQSLNAQNIATTDFIQAHILQPIVSRGFSEFYSDMNDPYANIMIKQAEIQRNTQWAAEQNIWVKSIRPLMTLFEGLVYAITPLAAFVMVIGAKGIALVGKYLQMLIWIQLWMPIMSIINLYIYTQGQEVLNQYSTYGHLSSFEGITYASTELERWLSIGGMMAASTPAIAFMLVSGSAIAMNSLSQRVAGGDHIDQKIMSPDLVNRGALLNQQPHFQQTPSTGTLSSGADSLLDKINIGQTLSSAVSSSHAASSQATKNFSEQLSNSIFSGSSAEQNYSQLQGLGKTLKASNSSQAKAVYDQAQNYSREYGLSESHTDAIAGAMTMRVLGGVDAGKLVSAIGGPINRIASATGISGTDSLLKAAGDISGSAESRTTDQRQQLTNDLDRSTQNLGFSKDDSASLAQEIARQTSSESGKRFTNSLGTESRKQLTQAATQSINAQETYQRLASAQHSLGSSSQMEIGAVAGSIINNPSAHSLLRNGMLMAKQETRQTASEKSNFYQALGMDSDRAQVGGQLYALLNSKNNDEQSVAAESISRATGSTINQDVGQFNEKMLLVQQAPNIKEPMQEQELNRPYHLTSTHAAQAFNQIPSGSGTADNIRQAYSEGINQVESSYNNNQIGFQKERLEALGAQIMNSNVTPSTAANIFSTAEGAGRFFDQIVGGSGAAINGISNDFANSMNQLAHMTPEQRDQFINDANNGDQFIQEKYGLPGYMATGAADIGRNIIGAGVSGYQAAKEWLTGESDLSEASKDMSMRERGMFFSSALASATESGADSAQLFIHEYSDEFRDLAVQTAIYEHGLSSESGAQLFASSLIGISNGKENEYREQLKIEIGNDDIGAKSAEVIESAANAGREQAGGYLSPISRYLSIKNRSNT